MPLPSGFPHLLVWKSLLEEGLWSALARSQTVVVVTALVTTCVWLVLQWMSARASRVYGPPGPPYPSRLERAFGRKPQEMKAPLQEWYHQLYKDHGPVFTVRTDSISTVVVCDQSIEQEMQQKDYAFSSISWTAWVLECSSASIRLPGWPLHSSVPSSYSDVNEILGYYLHSEFFEDCVTASLDSVISGVRRKHSEPFDPEQEMTSLAFDALYSLFFGKRLFKSEQYLQILRAHTRLNDLVKEQVLTLLGGSGEVPDSALSEIAALDHQISTVFAEEVSSLLKGEPSSGVTQCLAADLYHRCQVQSSAVDVPSLTRFLVDTFRDWLDTCRITLQWTLLYLGHFVHVQRQCQREMDSKLDGYAPCAHDRDLLTFTQAVLLEVSRLRPCRPLAAPCVVSQFITLGGYEVPDGLTVVINKWLMHHDRHHWDNPDNFQPRRFMNDDDCCILQPQPCSWEPSLTGQSPSSSAEELLRQKLLLLVSSLLYNFTVSLSPSSTGHLPDLTPCGTLWLRPRNFQVILEARQREERRRPASDWLRETMEFRDPPPSSSSPGVSSYARPQPQPRPSHCRPSAAPRGPQSSPDRRPPRWRGFRSLVVGRRSNTRDDGEAAITARPAIFRDAVAYYCIRAGMEGRDDEPDDFTDPDGENEEDSDDSGGPFDGRRDGLVYRRVVNGGKRQFCIDR